MDMLEILQKDPLIWDLFTRKEEYQSTVRDIYNRFPYFASRNRNIFEPQASEFLMKNGFHVEYPDNKSFAVCLTHDIDSVYKSITSKSLHAVKYVTQGKLNESVAAMKQMSSKKKPYCNFKEIMKLEEKYNARSSFFFLALDPADQDYEYRIEDLRDEISFIQDQGWEIGLHGGHQGSVDLDKLRNEKRNLEKVTSTAITGCRNHYLKFIVPDTWELLKKAGFIYDTTLGYADCVGFRNGMCHPFRPFNLLTGKPVDILEIPLTIMEDSFENYMRFDLKRAWEISKRLIDTVMRYNGVVTLLWHNKSLTGDQKKFYEKILNYCAEKDAWMTSGESIAAWWKEKIEV
jgi:peptidoglycan/xylan/chitin deacetylase (PgdA/CDA1 family)